MEFKITVGGTEKHEVVYKKDFWSGADQVWVDGKLFKKRPVCLSMKCKVTIGEQEKHEVVFICGLKEYFSMKPGVTVDGIRRDAAAQETTEDDKPFSTFRPKIRNQKDAEMAVISGVTAGVISIIITSIFVALPFFGMKTIPGIDATVFGDILIMTILVIGLAAKSRISACVLVLYFILSKIALLAANPDAIGSSMILTLIFLAMFINGARGTLAYWKFSEKKPKRFSWKILFSAFLILAILGFFGTMQGPDGTGPAADETWWQDLGNEIATLEIDGVPSDNATRIVGRPSKTEYDGGLFAVVEISPTKLKIGEKASVIYMLFTRYDTRYEGFVEQLDIGTMEGAVNDLGDDREGQTVRVMGKRFIAAKIADYELTPTQAGTQEIGLGGLLVTVRVKDEETGEIPEERSEAAIFFPTATLNVEEGTSTG